MTGQQKDREAAVRAMDAVLAEIVPERRWEDFETYWSCCGWGRDKYLGETGDRNYERGVAALKSGFIMMYCPENLAVKQMWEKVYPWFGPEDYGFTMENYGHGGRTSAEGRGMGVFTIYDWGNGAAAEAAMRILDHYGHVYIDRARGQAFGIDKVQVRRSASGWELVNETGQPRSLRVVFDDGATQDVQIREKAFVPAPGVAAASPANR